MLAEDDRTLIFYESTHRIEASVADMAAVFGGQRKAVIARELTKRFETVHGDSLSGLQAWLAADANQCRGEFVVLVQGASRSETDTQDAEAVRILTILLQELPTKQAAALAAKITGQKKNGLYRLGLSLSEKDN